MFPTSNPVAARHTAGPYRVKTRTHRRNPQSPYTIMDQAKYAHVRAARLLAVLLVPALLVVPVTASAQRAAERADSLFQAQAWPAAAAAYQAIVAGDSTQALAWYRLGRIYHEQGREEASLEALAAGARHGFNPLRIAFARARAYTALGRESEAVAQLQGAADSGFGQTGAVTMDPGLQPLLDNPALDPVLAQMEANGEPCMHSETARQLDFWVGKWDVYNPQGQKVGENEVQRLLKGCLLLENWTDGAGSQGKSMNFFDTLRQTWRQVWVAEQGNSLDYREGEYHDGRMVFLGLRLDQAGDTVQDRLTFVNVSPDTVRQEFEASSDGGETWTTTWVGIYVRRSEEMSALVPGDERLAVGRLVGVVDTFALAMIQDGQRRPVSTLVRSVERTSSGGDRALRVVQRYDRPGWTSVDSSLVNAETLAPLAYAYHGPDQASDWRWEEGRLTGQVTADGATRTEVTELDGPAFNAVVDELVLRALTLGPGEKYRWLGVNPGQGQADVTVNVEGRARLAGPMGPTAAWVLQYVGGGRRPATLWVATDSGALLGLRTELPNGATFEKVRTGYTLPRG